MIFLVLALGLFKYFVIDEEARWVREDLAISALDLFMEADASVILSRRITAAFRKPCRQQRCPPS